jgi:hypothetical protein
MPVMPWYVAAIVGRRIELGRDPARENVPVVACTLCAGTRNRFNRCPFADVTQPRLQWLAVVVFLHRVHFGNLGLRLWQALPSML